MDSSPPSLCVHSYTVGLLKCPALSWWKEPFLCVTSLSFGSSAVGIILGAALQVSLGTHQGGKGGIAFLLSCYPLNPDGGTEQPSLSAAAAWGLRRAELSADVGTQRCSGSITALCSH